MIWDLNSRLEKTQEKADENFSKIEARLNKMNETWERDRADLWKAINDLTAHANKPTDVTAIENRLAVLDTWRAQLHSLLVERGNTGKEKLSRTGNALAKFYGRG